MRSGLPADQILFFGETSNENARVCHHCVRSCHSGNVIRSANERPHDACRSTLPARHRRAGRPVASIKFAIPKNGSCVVTNRNSVRHLGVRPNCQRFVANSQSGDGCETFAVFPSLTGRRLHARRSPQRRTHCNKRVGALLNCTRHSALNRVVADPDRHCVA